MHNIDLDIHIDGHKVKCRSSAILLRDNHILLHKLRGDEFWALPGGKIHLAEFSSDALVREILEELQVEIDIVRPLWIAEQFYPSKRFIVHEFSYYFLASLRNRNDLSWGNDCFYSLSDEDLIFQWFNLEDLHDMDIRPNFLKNKLKDIPDSTHIIHANELL